jgi:hypothetical protein
MWTDGTSPMNVCTTAAMKIGDLVLHQGRQYYLRGLDPMSVPERQAFLEDASTGEARTAPMDEIEPEPPPESQSLQGV